MNSYLDSRLKVSGVYIDSTLVEDGVDGCVEEFGDESYGS